MSAPLMFSAIQRTVDARKKVVYLLQACTARAFSLLLSRVWVLQAGSPAKARTAR